MIKSFLIERRISCENVSEPLYCNPESAERPHGGLCPRRQGPPCGPFPRKFDEISDSNSAKDYKKYPGKQDHATCLVYRVGEFAPETLSPGPSPRPPNSNSNLNSNVTNGGVSPRTSRPASADVSPQRDKAGFGGEEKEKEKREHHRSSSHKSGSSSKPRRRHDRHGSKERKDIYLHMFRAVRSR